MVRLVIKGMSCSVLRMLCRAAVASAILAILPVAAQSVTIPAGVPLRVQIDHRYRGHPGAHIEGHLIAPVEHIDHVVLPVSTRVSGTILGMQRVSEPSRARALLNGQFTPPAVAAVRFDSLLLPNGVTLPIETAVTERDAEFVTMSVEAKHGFRAEARALIAAQKRAAMETLHHPHFGDRLGKWVYAQLPWRPPTIWTGTQYDAELTAPLTIDGPQPAPLPDGIIHGTPTGLVEARLVTPLNSATDYRGATITAVLTRPLLTKDGKQVLYPEGASMAGVAASGMPTLACHELPAALWRPFHRAAKSDPSEVSRTIPSPRPAVTSSTQP